MYALLSQRISIAAAAVLAMGVLQACSVHWTASMRFVGAGEAPRGLRISLSSRLGDRYEAVLVGDCVDVRLRQSPKVANKIAITIRDADDRIIGSAMTHDLARRGFVIPLTDTSGSIEVSPGRTCQ